MGIGYWIKIYFGKSCERREEVQKIIFKSWHLCKACLMSFDPLWSICGRSIQLQTQTTDLFPSWFRRHRKCIIALNKDMMFQNNVFHDCDLIKQTKCKFFQPILGLSGNHIRKVQRCKLQFHVGTILEYSNVKKRPNNLRLSSSQKPTPHNDRSSKKVWRLCFLQFFSLRM